METLIPLNLLIDVPERNSGQYVPCHLDNVAGDRTSVNTLTEDL